MEWILAAMAPLMERKRAAWYSRRSSQRLSLKKVFPLPDLVFLLTVSFFVCVLALTGRLGG
jgi:hypothetical protein